MRTGEIAVDLARPLDLQLSWWVRDLGRAAFALPTRGLGPLLVGALTIGVAFSETWTSYPLGIVSLLLGISVSFLCRYGMNLIAFWTVDVQGFLNLYTLVLGLLSGFYLPVHVFPEWLQTVAFASPFPAMFQAPIDVMSGRVVGAAAWRVIAWPGELDDWLGYPHPGRALASDPALGGAGWLTRCSRCGRATRSWSDRGSVPSWRTGRASWSTR